MIEITGKYGTAKVFNDYVEEEAIKQIYSLMSHPIAENSKIRIMPDVHKGAGCVIGYTATLTDKVVCNLIGVDIGCGVTAWHLDNGDIDYPLLDKIIREYVPSGTGVHKKGLNLKQIEEAYETLSIKLPFKEWLNDFKETSKKIGNFDYFYASLGSLGGGNHFIEIDQDENNKYLVVHSGSRNFGLKTAKFHQEKARNYCKYGYSKFNEMKQNIIDEYSLKGKEKEINRKIEELKRENTIHVDKGLEYLEGNDAENYYNDMKTAQIYALLNRRLIAQSICKNYKIKFNNIIESVHNYIDFDSKIIRKGAISAKTNEIIIIPLNMADGTLLCKGKGNDDWNYSAPHGAGRLMSRSKAKESVTLSEFKEKMENAGVWTSCISESTIDESPMAYKNSEEIKEYINDTAEIINHLKPVYNFKAN